MSGALVHDPAVVKLGKAEPKHDPRTLALSTYLTPALPSAPPTTNRRSKVRSWPMFANDKIGDCTCAAAGHMIELWTKLSGAEARVTTRQVVAAYSAITGYTPSNPATDQGAVELDVLNYWRSTGVANHKIGAYTQVHPQNLEQVKVGTWLFDGLYIGLGLPISAQRQQVWDVDPNAGSAGQPRSWGGHAVPVVDYNATGPLCITWGRVKQMTWAFWDAYCDEAYAVLSPDALRGGKTLEGFDLAALTADLAALRH